MGQEEKAKIYINKVLENPKTNEKQKLKAESFLKNKKIPLMVAIPKTKIVKQRVAQRTQEKEPQNKPQTLKPIKPIPPLKNKQSEY